MRLRSFALFPRKRASRPAAYLGAPASSRFVGPRLINLQTAFASTRSVAVQGRGEPHENVFARTGSTHEMAPSDAFRKDAGKLVRERRRPQQEQEG